MMKLFSQLSTDISIHALLAESDRCCPCAIIAPAISIHALLAESDLLPFAMTITALDFYPRSPCGERPKRYLPCCTSRIFLSTLSLRRATSDCRTWTYERLISIHALLAESDAAYVAKTGMTEISIHALLAESDRPAKPDRSAPDNFYPRSPCGERPCWRWDNPNTKPNFYPRSPCGERPASIFA